MKVFLSLPMSGRTDEEINNQIKEMTEAVENHFVIDRYLVIHDNFDYKPTTLLESDPVTIPLLYLGQAIKKIGMCDAVVFGENWERARGCRIEFLVAKEYDVPIYFMDGDRLRPGE